MADNLKSAYSNKTSFTVLPGGISSPQPRAKTPKEKIFTRDQARKKATSLKNVSTRIELTAVTADGTKEDPAHKVTISNYF